MSSADRPATSRPAEPVRMRRVALLAPGDRLHAALRALAEAGTVQLDRVGDDQPVADEERISEFARSAVRHGEVAALTGWTPQAELPDLASRLAGIGGAAVPLPVPPGVLPPTLLCEGGQVRRSFAALVRTYGTVPYPDVDPTPLAGIAYVLMFGMMFGDAGHGLVLLAVALLLRTGRPRGLASLHAAWPFVGAAGFAAVLFGALYGEFFGPTGVLPVLWLAPLEDPMRLLTAGVAVGAVLLGAAYAVAIVNRWREGGPRLAVYASSGVAGLALFLGLASAAAGRYLGSGALTVAGGGIAVLGLVLAGIGFHAEAGGGTSGAAQAGVELLDTVIRLGSNLFSFARLAAFGLTHAALGWLVWTGTTSLCRAGWAGVLAGVLVFAAGNALAFTLEVLVAAVQALRLEFYELFSRVFVGTGEPFRPWRLPARDRPDGVVS
ncbi:V/A-type H+-transporting ATPase subunit I [Crossiella equi]|uniref:V/A-type H+-transporting ATPase subunit I n=1 Tax=Crossiella equi TaxID=130796 RepID=A0ABS5AQZ4_9PSEU|nr:V-type ATPase 116kDa subunit family protein [Crossiella equi]MBP2478851.1 V/A-type H+-transporting ATPase subunit I [Crossiella equi]